MDILKINARIVFDKRWDATAKQNVNPQTTLGDFNKDGLTDIAVNIMDIDAATNDLHILLAKSDGSFFDGNYLISKLIPTYQTSNILSSDLNKDGYTDLIIGRSGGDRDTTSDLYGATQLIYLSDGNGGYQPIESPTSPYIHNVMIADVNNDGYVDAFFLATGLGPSVLALNQTDADGRFLFTTRGLPDKAINSGTVEAWEVLSHYPNGWIEVAKGFHQHNTAFNDVNRDGKLDMVMFFAGSQEGLIYLNSGDGDIPNFSNQKPLEFNSVLTGFPSSGNYYYFIHKNDTSDPVLRNIKQGTNYYETIQFDIDGDGWEDVLAVAAYENKDFQDQNGVITYAPGTDQYNHGVMYQSLINSGSGLIDQTDQRITQPLVNFKTDYHYGQYTMLSMVDLNGDGYMDFTSEQNSSINYGKANWAGDSDTIFMVNDGSGNFKPITIQGMEYGSYDPVPIDGKLGFIANIVPTDFQWDLQGFPPRPYWEAKFIQTDTPWTIGDQKNNHLYGTVANDKIDGGDGVDIYHGMGRSEQFAWSISSSHVVLTDLHGLEGVDEIKNVERLQFYDKLIALDTDSANSAGGIYRLYQAAFDRQPDLPGLGYWIKAADNGKSAVTMAEDFTWSKEFLDLFHLTTPKDNYFTGVEVKTLVEGMYQHVLHRAPDVGGLNYYSGVIASHEKTVGRVLAEISDSPENHTAVASTIANGIEYLPYAGVAMAPEIVPVTLIGQLPWTVLD